ncbi:ABC transporter ATP-binding protein [Candidatus Pacearchaeota archaeon]|nr:ABC transporter ATP-binding protein [Candidatus Pacearchaeota archaeon]
MSNENMKNKKREKKIEFKYNLSVYWSFLRKYIWIVIFIMFVSLVIESRHVIQSYLLKVVIDNGTLFSAGSLAIAQFTKMLMIVIIVFAIIILVGFIFRWLYLHFINMLESKLILDIKRKFFNHLIELDHGFHVTHKTGSLISRLTRGRGATERLTDVITFNVAPMFFNLAVVVGSLLYFDWISALVVFVTIIAFVGYSLFIQRISSEANLLANEAEDWEKANIADIFTNVDAIKYFGKEESVKKKFEKLNKYTVSSILRHWNYFRWLDSVQSLILGTGTFLVIYFPLMQFLHGQLSLGTIVFIYTAYITLQGPLFGFVHGLREFYRAMADFQDLFEYGKIESKIKDKEGARDLKVEKGEIDIENITFSYDSRKIFHNFSLKIPANKKVALVGHSGSGKTTLVKLLYRLYNVNSGRILIDGKDIRDFKQESLREEMAIVPQECVLFDDTIYNNVAFSKPGATRKEVMKAIKFAQLDKIINLFPNKENTIVGERGVKLSGGEKQRVSIARAILANKKILVLDEATSSLDSETEFEIKRDLEKLMQGRTNVIIAHRLSTIMKADVIVVLKKGEIVQVGNHNKLISQPGEYKKLWNLQKGGYIK